MNKKLLFPLCIFMAIAATLPAQSGQQLFNLHGVNDIPRVPARQDLYWPVNVGDYDICHWDHDRFAALSITIDDNIAQDHVWWLQMAETYDLKLTWFVITQNIDSGNTSSGTWAGFQDLVDAGHSIQSHTVTHGNQEYIPDYEDSQVAINENISGQLAETLAYPDPSRVDPKPDIAKDYYIGARGVVGIPNRTHQINYMQTGSASGQIRADYIDSVLFGTSGVSWLGNNQYIRGWLCTHFHFVNNKTVIEADLEYIDELRDMIWMATFDDVIRYVQQRDTAEVEVTESTDNRIVFELSDWMDDSIYDHPLALKFRIGDDWSEVMATQAGEPVDCNVVEREGKQYAVVRAVPDKGEVVLFNDVEEVTETWAGMNVDQNGYVFAAEAIGWIYVREKPWIWVDHLAGWTYLPEPDAGYDALWVWFPQL